MDLTSLHRPLFGYEPPQIDVGSGQRGVEANSVLERTPRLRHLVRFHLRESKVEVSHRVFRLQSHCASKSGAGF